MIKKSDIYYLPFVKAMPTKIFLSLHYRISCKKHLNLKNPKGFNAKLQWLKLYDRKDIYTRMVDKYEAKKIVSERIGDEYVVKTLGIWKRFEDIDFAGLPNQFVLKCTHDSGGLVICHDKSKLDIEAARRKIERSLKRNYFYLGREWPYKNVPPRIIAEEYLANLDENGNDTRKSLDVYKIMTFGGVPKIIQTIQGDKTADEVIDYFDTKWNHLEMRQDYPNSDNPLPKPIQLDKMLELAATMSQSHPFLRVDFYAVRDELLFSEFTFYSDNGFAPFTPDSWDETLGEWIDLSMVNKV